MRGDKTVGIKKKASPGKGLAVKKTSKLNQFAPTAA